MDEREILRIAVSHDIDSYLTEALTLEFVRDVLKAARRTTPDREAWQPIETAPNEGQFLVYMPEETRQPIQVARWHPNVKVIGNAFVFDLPNPTHWMPLPAAPGQTSVASPRDTLIEEIAEMVDHMGEGRRLEEYVGAIREMKGGKS